MKSSWYMNVVRELVGMLDSVIYDLFAKLFDFFYDLANLKIISSSGIEDMYNRVYVLLGIFMLFRVSFSFINYIINPDLFSDKTQGVGNIIKNVIITLAMLIICPFAFNLLYEIQSDILNENIISNFVYGGQTGSKLSYNPSTSICQDGLQFKESEQGDYMAMTIFSPFYQVNSDYVDEVKDDWTFTDYYCSNKVSTMIDSDVYNRKKDKYYVLNYNIPLSTVVGVVGCLIMVSFCFDVAKRSVKLGFLQLIAPIPIISFVDPKSGKDGMFHKWLFEVGGTWASIFIRLASLYLGTYFIQYLNIGISKLELVDTSYKLRTTGVGLLILQAFVVLGILMFAKELPGLIEKIIGFKGAGKFELNPLKNIRENALFGKSISGLASGALAGTAAAGANMLSRGIDLKRAIQSGDRKQIANSIGKMALSPAAGFTSAFTKGFSGGRRGDTLGKAFSNAYHTSQINKMRRDDFGARGSTLGGRLKVNMQQQLGMLTDAQVEDITGGKLKSESQAYDTYVGYKDSIDSILETEVLSAGEAATQTTFTYTDHNGANQSLTANVELLKENLESLRNSSSSTPEQLVDAQNAYTAALKQAKKDYFSSHQNSDSRLSAYRDAMNRLRSENDDLAGFAAISDVTDGVSLYDNAKSVKSANTTLKVSQGYIDNVENRATDKAHIDQEAAKPRGPGHPRDFAPGSDRTRL